jgi:glycolate oxidase iron-sulfur subunit
MKPLDELTAKCIRCGFCLESCPTFLETGQETESPRGRIYLVRSADEGHIPWDKAKPHIDQCLGCLACETACPSGVDYSEIFELARNKLESQKPNKAKKLLLDAITNPKKLKTQIALGALLPGTKLPKLLSKALSGQSPEADKPKSQPLAEWPPLQTTTPLKGEVYLLEGCAMRVLFPRVHRATRRLLRRVGYTVKETEAGCCGALHVHNGYLDQAQSMARDLMSHMPENLTVIVNSAGCGSVMKEYEDPQFASRVQDISEFLLQNGLLESLAQAHKLNPTKIAYHDACHLAHGQGVRTQPRALLEAIPNVQLIPLPEADTCCGSAGIYNLTQPRMARQLLERKWKNIEATGAQIIALGNPGCHAWIAQAAKEHDSPIRVVHTAEVLESAYSGLP